MNVNRSDEDVVQYLASVIRDKTMHFEHLVAQARARVSSEGHGIVLFPEVHQIMDFDTAIL